MTKYNAGMPLSIGDTGNSVTVAVFIEFSLGKPVGILTFSWLVIRLGIVLLPEDLDWRLIAGGSLLAGIGFTMALFIASPAFNDALIDSVKLGIYLASIFSELAGLSLLMWLTTKGKHGQIERD